MKLVNPYRTILVNFEPSTVRLYITPLLPKTKPTMGSLILLVYIHYNIILPNMMPRIAWMISSACLWD